MIPGNAPAPRVPRRSPPRRSWLEFLKIFVHSPSVVGAERPFLLTLAREMEALGLSTTQYAGLLAVLGPRPDEALVSVHVDRHGLICTGPREFQYAAFIAQHKGERDGDSVSEQTYKLLLERFVGAEVVAYEPWGGAYLGRGAIREAQFCERRGNVFFEVGDLDHVPAGCPVAYADYLESNDSYVAAQLDNVLSVALAAALFAEGFAGTVLFTCQEEAGRSWRFVHDYVVRTSCRPKRFLVLDTSPFPDSASATRQQVVLRRRDAHAEFDRRLADELRGYCENLGVAYGFKDEFVESENRRRLAEGRRPMSYGNTELGRLAAFSGGLMNGVTVQIPTTGYHTNEETAAVEAVEGVHRLLASILLERNP